MGAILGPSSYARKPYLLTCSKYWKKAVNSLAAFLQSFPIKILKQSFFALVVKVKHLIHSYAQWTAIPLINVSCICFSGCEMRYPKALHHPELLIIPQIQLEKFL
jgi:hypothetical protein